MNKVSSMTGFGIGRSQREDLRYEVRLKGVNHRFLDIVMRLPPELESSAEGLKDKVRNRVARGRIELSVHRKGLGVAPVKVRLDKEAITALYIALCDVASDLQAPRPNLSDVLDLGDLVHFEEADRVEEVDQSESRLLADALDEALSSFVAVRHAEGAKLAGVVADAVGTLRSELALLEALVSGDMEARMARLTKRAAELFAGQLDPIRLHTEAALLAERADVREELDRLQMHFEAFEEALEMGANIGKRLDFLCQEILRELNTAGSKLAGGKARHKVVDMKTLLEQVREQVRNVE